MLNQTTRTEGQINFTPEYNIRLAMEAIRLGREKCRKEIAAAQETFRNNQLLIRKAIDNNAMTKPFAITKPLWMRVGKEPSSKP